MAVQLLVVRVSRSLALHRIDAEEKPLLLRSAKVMVQLLVAVAP